MALRSISADSFARRLKSITDEEGDEKRYVFFLGAGCSVSSGVPDAATLVREDWLPRLRDFEAPGRDDVEAWAREVLPDWDAENAALFYGPVMERLFLDPESQQREVERLCDACYPGFGYAVLAALMAWMGGCFNVVLTTNFDDLMADALYLYTESRPIVIQHESLAGFIRPGRRRPLIVKLHGDYRLEPKNTNAQTAELETELARQVRVLLQDRGLIFMGYGGNDAGVVRVLDALPLAPAALPLGVYWLSPAKPNTAIADWLERRDAIWVKSDDFDEMMVLVKDRFTVPHPDEKRFERVFRNYMETYVSLSGRIASLPDTAAEAPALKAAASRIDESFTGWWAVELAARRVKEEDPEQADRIYRKGLKRFPNSPELLGNYVGFLLAAGRRDEGLPLLDRILGMLGLTGRTDLPAECWFYALAHRPAEQRREALANLKRVLVGGGRSRDWDLSRNIERARQDGHPDVEWLEKLAQVINGKADISVLDEWDKWRETEV